MAGKNSYICNIVFLARDIGKAGRSRDLLVFSQLEKAASSQLYTKEKFKAIANPERKYKKIVISYF